MPTSTKPTPRVLFAARLPAPLVAWIKATADKRGMTVQSFVTQRLTMDMIRMRTSKKKGA
jgi:predicted DNA binding CopG/RHH family protein